MPIRRTKKVTDAVLAAFKRLPKGNSKEIGALAGVRHEYVRTVLRRNGIDLATKLVRKPKRTTPVRKYRRLQEWEQEAIAMAYADGEKLSAIAVEFGVDDSTVSRLAERRGLPRRNSVNRDLPKVSPQEDESFASYRRRLAQARRKAVEDRRHP